MKKFLIICSFYLINLSMNATAQPLSQSAKINYHLTFPEAQAHYVNIEMSISGLTQKFIDLKMPVWTPGSYLVREFAKNIESLAAFANGKEIVVNKLNKNTWRVVNDSSKTIVVKYKIYCFEVSVRTNFIDAAHAFLSSAGTFIYPDGMLNEPSTIHITPYKKWSAVSTSLEGIDGNQFALYSPNYDILFDSPIEVGNQELIHFDVANVKYEIAMCGGGNYDKEKLKTDFTKIINEETAIFGENPNSRYVFIVHNYMKGGGGLEHLSSTVLGATREGYVIDATYHNFLALAAHEHFHLWNVKRLRPIALGPFDYETENYTNNLWIAEGFTSYYQNLILRRADLLPTEDFLKGTAANLTTVDNTPGAGEQSLHDASYDAWIKYYRPNENSVNSAISYYSKGAIIALMLDLEIIADSKGTRSLDDVMHYMYNEYYKLKHRGYTDSEFKAGLEKFAGRNLDEFYKKYIYGTEHADYNEYFKLAGYQLMDEQAAKTEPFLGAVVAKVNNKLMVTNVLRNTAAWLDGINANDELIAVDYESVTEADQIITGKKIGDLINVTVIRDGLQLSIPVTLLKNTQVKYKITELSNVNKDMKAVRKKWLKLQ